MEYVDGLTLSEHVKEHGPLSPEEGVHVAKQIASSLVDAHGDGLVHRDLKPGNVMIVTQGGDPLFVKVLDFGLVKLAGGTDEQKKKLTQSGILMGSPRYMAPEQVRGTDVDARTDIYSFGALLCFILTGKPPFSAGSQFEAMRAHVHTPAPSLRDLAPDIQASLGLESVVGQCLAKDPAERFQSMSDVFRALDLLNSETRVSVPNPRPTMLQGGASGGGGADSIEGTNSSITSFLTAAIVSPGKSKAKWVTRITLMCLVVAVGVSLAVLVPKSSQPTATTLPPLENEPETAVAEPILPAVEAVEAVVAPVQIRVEPPSADITRDGVLLGSGNVTLNVPAGERWVLTLEASGFVARTITVTSQSQPLAITLEEVLEDEPEARQNDDRDSRPRDTSMSRMRPDMEPATTMMGTLSPIRDPWD
jgi:serine/threonine protein kinase